MAADGSGFPLKGGDAPPGDKPAAKKKRKSAATRKHTNPPRGGAPRPLAMHIAAGLADLQQGVALAARLDDPRFPWRDSLRSAADALAGRISADSEARQAFAKEVARIALDDVSTALEGVAQYRAAAPVRRPADPPTVWRLGSARLLDFAPDAGPDAAPILAAPSLVNSPAILDLTRARSMLRGLAKRGLRPFLLDWGRPSGEERDFDVAAYVARRGAPAALAAAEIAGRPIALLGHCMGGALAAGVATIAPERVSHLALLATPWDFRPITGGEFGHPFASQLRGPLTALLRVSRDVFGGVPPDLLNTIFFMNDPLQTMRKFPLAARIARRGPRERLFIAVEDWLNDGKLLSAPAAENLFIDWALDHQLASGAWRVDAGAAGLREVRLGSLEAPILIAASRTDTLTPFASARGALMAARDARLIRPSGGHIGMIVGRRAEAELWDPLAAWVRERAA